MLRAFEDDTIPHVGPVDPLRDIGNVEIDLIVSDLTQIEKRLERVAKDMKKAKTPEVEREHDLLLRCKQQTEAEKPLREMEMTPEEKKLIRGFMFLSQKPILYVLNICESTTLGARPGSGRRQIRPHRSRRAPQLRRHRDLRQSGSRAGGDERRRSRRIPGSYGLTESGLARLIRKSYELLGLISFFTVGEDECRAWTIRSTPRPGSRGRDPHRPARSTSSAPRPSTGTSCSPRARRQPRAPPANCGWKARNTSSRTATCSTSVTAARAFLYKV